jgi:acetyl esterase/lipase
LRHKNAVIMLAMAFLSVAAAEAAPPTFLPAPDTKDAIAIPMATAPAQMPPEQWLSFWGQRVVRNVSVPMLTPVLPDPAKATGAAMIVAPGGGFRMLSMDSEGFDVARRLADAGIAAFVLKYRLLPTPADPAAFPAVIGRLMAGRGAAEDLRDPPATQDALAALALVRRNAARWHVDPARVGIVGFSAGAVTALQTILDKDPTARPALAGLIYGQMDAVAVSPDAPPVFIALANDDPLFGHRGFAIAQSWLDAHRPMELHAYEAGGHGFGMRVQGKSSDGWIDDWIRWLRVHGWSR